MPPYYYVFPTSVFNTLFLSISISVTTSFFNSFVVDLSKESSWFLFLNHLLNVENIYNCWDQPSWCLEDYVCAYCKNRTNFSVGDQLQCNWARLHSFSLYVVWMLVYRITYLCFVFFIQSGVYLMLNQMKGCVSATDFHETMFVMLLMYLSIHAFIIL